MSYPDYEKQPLRSTPAIPPEQVKQILAHLPSSVSPSDTTLPVPPLEFLQAHFEAIPTNLLIAFDDPVTTSRDRSRIKQVKARRMAFAYGPDMGIGGTKSTRLDRGGIPLKPYNKPRELTAQEGWRRWPLLWESLGGDPLGPKSISGTAEDQHDVGTGQGSGQPDSSLLPSIRNNQAFAESSGNTGGPSWRMRDESAWATSAFMPSTDPLATPSEAAEHRKSVLQVNKLGHFLASLEEEREWEDVRDAKRTERRFNQEQDAKKEEFEDSSDEEVEEGEAAVVIEVDDDQQRVIAKFERRLLELFLDGLDVSSRSHHRAPWCEWKLYTDALPMAYHQTIPYGPIDFEPPVVENKLMVQDEEDAYFDQEDAVDLSSSVNDRPANSGLAEGEYDY